MAIQWFILGDFIVIKKIQFFLLGLCKCDTLTNNTAKNNKTSHQNYQSFILTVTLLSRVFLFSRWFPVRSMWLSDWAVSLSHPLPWTDLWSMFKGVLETVPVRTLPAMWLWPHQVIQRHVWPGMSSAYLQLSFYSFLLEPNIQVECFH